MISTNGTINLEASPINRRGFDNFFQVVCNSYGVFDDVHNAKSRQAVDMITNAVVSRAELIKTLMDPRRDVYDSCGLTKANLGWRNFQFLYEREAVAARVVEVMPRECWQVTPVVYEDEEGEVATAFEEAWDEVGRTIGGEDSWFEDDRGNPVFEWLERADVRCGIGTYGIILLGLDDGAKNLSDPVPLVGDKGYNARKPRRLQYVRVFSEGEARISERERERNSPRYGQPTMYEVSLDTDPATSVLTTDGAATGTDTRVHWTRVVHVVDNVEGSVIFGAPRMRPVYNNLAGIQKVTHGSAEMYWLGALPGISLEGTAQNAGARFPMAQLREMMFDYFNDLQRFIALKGMTAKPLAPQVVSPRDQIDIQIEAICIKLGIPKRIFMGSERGELASSQDDASWNDRLRARQRSQINPRVVAPFVNRLIQLGVLPRPKDRYRIWWPDLDSQTDAEKANIALTKTNALVAYAGQPAAQDTYTRYEFLTRIMGHTEEEAQVIIDNADEDKARRDQEEMDKLQQQYDIAGQNQPADQGGAYGDGTGDAADTSAATDVPAELPLVGGGA